MLSKPFCQNSLIAIFILLSIPCWAQIADYPLADYARPDLQRITSFYGGDVALRNSQIKEIDQDLDTDFSLQLNPRWRNRVFKNTEKYQIQSGTGIDFRMSYTKDNDFQNTKNIIELRPFLQRSYSKKTFFKNQRFFELNYQVEVDEMASFYRYVVTDDREGRSVFNSNLELSLLLGKGRLELVNDAWHAQTILELLDAQNLLEKGMSVEDIETFANRISEIKNFRNTDFRLEEIAEYEALCTHLVENNIMDAEKYRSFAVLLDAWRYESFTQRLSGREWKFGLKPSLFYYDLHIWRPDETVFTKINRPKAFFSAAYNWYKPTSMDWQFNMSNELNAGINWTNTRTDSMDTFEEKPYFIGNVNTNWEVQYLPNQRTNYTIGLKSFYQYGAILSDTNELGDIHTIRFNLEGIYRYYVSPRLVWRLSGNFNFEGNKQSELTYENGNSLIFSLTYVLQ